MRLKRAIMSVVLTFALITPIVAPQTLTTFVSKAETTFNYNKTNASVRKKFRKLKTGQTKKKVKKIMGKGLGKGVLNEINKQTEYTLKYNVGDGINDDGKHFVIWIEIHLGFWGNKLDCKQLDTRIQFDNGEYND